MRHSTCVAAVMCTATFLPLTTARAAFSYQSCSTNVYSPTVLPVNTGTAEFERYSQAPGFYNNNEYSYWSVFFSPTVGIVVPSLNNVWLNGSDFLSIASAYEGYMYTGNNPNGFAGALLIGDSTTQYPNNIQFLWKTDASGNEASTPTVNSLALVCSATIPPPVSWNIGNNYRIEGVLLGTGDTHYFNVSHSPNERVAISVEVLASPTTSPDLDLYVSKTNRFPDQTSYDYIDFSGNSTGTIAGGGAFINLPSQGNGTYYIGIHSYVGAAHYVLHVSAYPTTTKTAYTICGEIPLSTTAPYWAPYVQFLKELSGRVAQYTNGGIWPMTWTHKIVPTGTCSSSGDPSLYPYCGPVAGCDFVLKPVDGCGFKSIPGYRTYIPDPARGCTQYSNVDSISFYIAHEFGHSMLSFGDEYINGNEPWCGHTIMDGPYDSHTLCTATDHCLDPVAGGVPPAGRCAAGQDNWSLLAAAGLVPYSRPPAGVLPDQWDSLRTSAQFYANGVTVTP